VVSIPARWPRVLEFLGTPLVIELSPGRVSSDGGLLPVCQSGQRVACTQTSPAARAGAGDPDSTEHTSLKKGRSRVFRILAGYEVQNAHSTLGTGPGSNWSRIAHRLNRASEEDAKWLQGLLNRLGEPFGTHVQMEGDNSLTLRWR
jgi:hypothetical protein